MSVRVRREGVAYATGRGLSQRRACTLLSVARSALAYQPRKPVSDATVLSHMGELARRYPKPTSWYDLLDPRFRGRITMPDPSSSGTGYFHVSAWIQLFGEEEAWRFMDRLHANIATYEHSGTKPCRNAATGEFTVGISYELAGAQAKQRGAPVDVRLMKEGGGWDMDAGRDLKGHPQSRSGPSAAGIRGESPGERGLCSVHSASGD